MPTYSNHSRKIISTCDERIQKILNEVIKIMDCRAISGQRKEQEQNQLFYAGRSKVKFPHSRHNKLPLSGAIDIAPYPIDWNDRERFTYFAGIVKGVAWSMGYKVTWGGDWDNDFNLKNNKFDDLAHFQIEND